jgi:plasmid stabilization system protein ParE
MPSPLRSRVAAGWWVTGDAEDMGRLADPHRTVAVEAQASRRPRDGGGLPDRLRHDVTTKGPSRRVQERELGDRFLDAIHSTVLRASQWPNSGTPALRDEIVERKLPANGFPYAVRYRILDDDRLIVTAVLHQHRHPESGTDRQP